VRSLCVSPETVSIAKALPPTATAVAKEAEPDCVVTALGIAVAAFVAGRDRGVLGVGGIVCGGRGVAAGGSVRAKAINAVRASRPRWARVGLRWNVLYLCVQ
jgi:hypothetical protein